MKHFLKNTITGEYGVWRAILHWIISYTAGVILLFAVDSMFPPSAELFYFTILVFFAVSAWFTIGVIISGYRQMKYAGNSFSKRMVGVVFSFLFICVAYLLYSDVALIL